MQQSVASPRQPTTVESVIRTSIGSWPGQSIEQALEWAFSLDVPALPELPELAPSESLLGQAQGHAPLALGAFVERVRTHPPASGWVKFQRAGPLTLERGASLRQAQARARTHESLRPILNAQLPVGVRRLVLLDEPMHGAQEADLDSTEATLAELVRTNPSTTFGIHCCGKAPVVTGLLTRPWPALSVDLGVFQPGPTLTEALGQIEARARAGLLTIVAFEGASPLPDSAWIWRSPSCGLAGRATAEIPTRLSLLLP